jgi:hypothetical protein
MKNLVPYFVVAAICLLIGYFVGATVVLKGQQRKQGAQTAEDARINEYIKSLNLTK